MNTRRTLSTSLIFVSSIALAVSAGAEEPIPLGGEFQVNEVTTGSQVRPQISSSSAGFVVVWEDVDAGCGLSGTQPCAEGRVFDDEANPVGGDFALSSVTTTDQFTPAVAVAPDGSFVAAWNEGLSVQARRFDSSGVGLAAEAPANDTALVAGAPAIDLETGGGFVVAWSSDTGGAASQDVRIRRFDSSGVALDTAFVANAYTSAAQTDPDLAVNADGSFVAVWSSLGCTGCADTDGQSIRAARFSDLDVGLGDFLVNTTTAGAQVAPAIAPLPGAGFVVAWNDAGVAARAQLFDSIGTPLGGEILASGTGASVSEVDVSTVDGTGEFVVSWTAEPVTRRRRGVTPPDIEARAFDAAGTPVGGVFQVNQFTTGAQDGSSVAHLGENFVVAFATDAAVAPADIAFAPFRPSVPPQTFLVTKTADTADGVCDADCSLREAIVAANVNAPAADTIEIPSDTYLITRSGSDNAAFVGDLDITDDVTLVVLANRGGSVTPATVDGNGLDDVFDVGAGGNTQVTVTMSDLIITGGNSGSGGGGLDNAGTLTMIRCRVTENTAGAEAGGILNEGDLTLLDSRVDANIAGGDGGGIGNEGVLVMERSSVTGNTASGSGGGILHLGTSLTVENSTVSGNTALGVIGGGGGIALIGDAVITQSTIANNSSAAGGGSMALFGPELPAVVVTNSVLAGGCNTDDVTSGSGNIESPGDTCFLTVEVGDQVDVSEVALKLGPLADNGGGTLTQLLLPGSVAIDVAGADAACLATDQRGVVRPVDGNGDESALCDVGAVEAIEGEGGALFSDGFEGGNFDAWDGVVPAP